MLYILLLEELLLLPPLLLLLQLLVLQLWDRIWKLKLWLKVQQLMQRMERPLLHLLRWWWMLGLQGSRGGARRWVS